MAYSKNPYLPKVRANAVEMLRSGKTVRFVARHFGVSIGAVSKWNKKVPLGGASIIPTQSSRPKSHPKQVSPSVVKRIREIRLTLNGRCAEAIQKHLEAEGTKVHRITVQRVLDRQGLTRKRSPWKRLHISSKRPNLTKPGDLVQVDTIHLLQGRLYVYTLIDVYSRWSYAWAVEKINAVQSVKFLQKAQREAPFPFHCTQSDNGSEFSTHFSERIKITHRHSRVRRPNDNAHLERFNRTIQDELLRKLPMDAKAINRKIPKYLHYYNQERYHLGINLKTPLELVQKCFQAIV